MTAKKRNFTAELKRAQARGAKIVCSLAPCNGDEVIYQPRRKLDPSPWVLKVGFHNAYRFSGRECHAEWPEGTSPIKVTETQQLVLGCLRKSNGVWGPGCGWKLSGRFTTMRHLNVLVNKGLVEQIRFEEYREEYRITEAGVEAHRATQIHTRSESQQ